MVILETALACMKKKIIFLAEISIIFVLFSGCIQEIKPSEESDNYTIYDESCNYTIYNYSTPGFEISQNQASEAWEKVKYSDDAKFITREKNYSVTVFAQPYNRVSFAHSSFYLDSAEWIVVTSSIPKETEDVKIAIFRLDYQTFDFKRSYYFSYPQTKELTLQQSIAIMEEELKKEPGGSRTINESAVVLRDGNYIYSDMSPDFGETMFLFNWDEIPWKENGRLIYFLEREHHFYFSRHTNIEKIENNRTIRVNDGTILLRLNDERTKVNLKTDDGRTAELVARMENGKLNIYGATTDKGPTIILNKYAGRILFHAIFRAGKEIWIKETGNEPGGIFIFPGEEVNGTTLLPSIETRFEPVNPPAYRGTSTVAKLSFAASNNPPNGSEINVQYRTEVLHADGSPQSENDGFYIIPEKKKLIFPGRDGQMTAYSNLTIKTGTKAAEGDYLITITSRYRGLVAGKIVLSFKIGKGGKKSGGKSVSEGSQNIGYSAADPLPINATEKTEVTEVALRDPYLKGRTFKIIGETSEFLDLENYSGFFAVVTVDVEDPDYPGEIIRYIIDREEKKIIGSSSIPRMALEYFRGEAFDEANGNFTKRWDAWNFPGLWLDPETNVSTEELVIDQKLLDSSNRIIEKHNFRYTTNLVPFKYQVYTQLNCTPEGTDGFYQAIGWLGEKYVYLQGNGLARIILEQNAFEVKTLTVGESWNMGEGYKLTANSIDAKASGRQAWFTLSNKTNKLKDKVLGPGKDYLSDTGTYAGGIMSYLQKNDSVPVFITYLNMVYPTLRMDAADMKYTWLRSQNTIDIKSGDIFGLMEVTSVDNGIIELRNRVPIELAPGATINLMGNLNFKVGSSNTNLLFHPYRVKDPNVR